MSLIHRLSRLALVVAVVVFGGIRPTDAQLLTAVNRGVVALETTGSTGISVRIAEDLANLIDDGSTRRLLPVIGKGSLQNVTDLKYLRGIDIAILQEDVLDFARDQRLFPGLKSSITYITKLYVEEFHLLARSNIASIADLDHRNVNFDLRSSGTAITATRIFNSLKLKVNPVYDSPQVALEKLRSGEIAAVAFVAGRPAPLFGSIKETDQFRLLDVPYKFTATSAYAPTRLTSTDYPLLVPRDRPVETIAVGSILVAADLQQIPERYQNTVNFIDAFFTGFQSLLGPGNHPKWQEVSLAAEVQGWRRHPAAEQWLQRNSQISRIRDPEVLKTMFSQFIDQRRQAAHGEPMTEQEKAALFQQFQVWRDRQGR